MFEIDQTTNVLRTDLFVNLYFSLGMFLLSYLGTQGPIKELTYR